VRKLFIVAMAISSLAVAAVFAGPIASGGLLLLRPAATSAESEALADDYTPRHKGGIDLATGLYTRENEDVFVPGAPALVLRRTYLSRDRISRAFGIGATHPGEEYLIGDGEQFQWASLILATGVRINFRRTSVGTSLLNAMFVHDESPTDWQGAQLGWTGVSWAIRKRDGSLSIYRGCGRGSVCSIVQSRDGSGQSVHYRRDTSGTLQKMDDGNGRWIAFDNDGQGRIIRAITSTGKEARYDYDGRGRLERVRMDDGTVRLYTYTDLDELATIEEPGTSIENVYENGRCVRQVNRYPDGEPLIFTFAYHVESNRIVRTDTARSDGSWTQFTWDAGRYSTSETWGHRGVDPATVTYDRDPVTKRITALTVTCPDRQGLPLRHSSIVGPGRLEAVKQNLLATHCHWNRWRAPSRSVR
jgi:YD repeat-containing protein